MEVKLTLDSRDKYGERLMKGMRNGGDEIPLIISGIAFHLVGRQEESHLIREDEQTYEIVTFRLKG